MDSPRHFWLNSSNIFEMFQKQFFPAVQRVTAWSESFSILHLFAYQKWSLLGFSVCDGFPGWLSWLHWEPPRLRKHTSRHVCERISTDGKLRRGDLIWSWAIPSYVLRAGGNVEKEDIVPPPYKLYSSKELKKRVSMVEDLCHNVVSAELSNIRINEL